MTSQLWRALSLLCGVSICAGAVTACSDSADPDPDPAHIEPISDGPPDVPGPPMVPPNAHCASLAFVRRGVVLSTSCDGSESPVVLATEGSRPAWSPDGSRIAFTRPAYGLARWQLCIARPDGSDARC